MSDDADGFLASKAFTNNSTHEVHEGRSPRIDWIGSKHISPGACGGARHGPEFLDDGILADRRRPFWMEEADYSYERYRYWAERLPGVKRLWHRPSNYVRQHIVFKEDAS